MRKVGDLVLIYYMGKPSVYARIEAIEPDVKDGWYQVKLLILSIPAQLVTWILREEYIDGNTFTMGGIPIRLGDVEIGTPSKMLEKIEKELGEKDKKKSSQKKSTSKVIELRRHKEDK